MKKLFCLSLMFLLFQVALFAQNVTVKGTVVDENEKPLSGVNVTAQGSKKGAVTDAQGVFSIKATGNATVDLFFNKTGYNQAMISSDGTAEIKVKMTPVSKALPEVTVSLGYKKAAQKNLPAAVSHLNANEIKDLPGNSVSELIAGRLAGVQVVSSEGVLGQKPTVTVRGSSSLTQASTPLYVINGVAVENGIEDLNPQDIESIDVLKDGALTSLYGVRGANGVVVITTKNGRPGKPKITYNGFVGVNSFTKDDALKTMSAYDFVSFQYERSRGNQDLEDNFAALYGPYSSLSKYKNVGNTNWQDKIYDKDGFLQTHNLGVSGGNASTQYYFNIGYNNSDGIMKNSEYDRKSASFRLDNQTTAKLKLGFDARYVNENLNGAGMSDTGTQMQNRLRHSIQYKPFIADSLENSFETDYYYSTLIGDSSLGLINPLLVNDNEYRNRLTNIFNIGANLSYAFSNKFTFKSVFSVNNNDKTYNAVSGVLTPSGFYNANQDVLNLNQTASINKVNRVSITNTNTLAYSNAFSDGSTKGKHYVDVFIGEETNSMKVKHLFNSRLDVPSYLTPKKALAQMNQGSADEGSPYTYYTDNNMLSFFGSANYSFDKRFEATFTVRTDGVSTAGSDKEWGSFLGGGLAWNITREKFMEGVASKGTQIKLRLSGGRSANKRLDDYDYINTLYNTDSSYIISQTNLPWETTTSYNAGVDLLLFKNRVSLSADLYRSTTSDVMIYPTTPAYFANQIDNNAEVRNQGLELQLNALLIQKKDFTWSAGFNISFNKNKIEKIADATAFAPEQTSFTYNSGWGVAADDYIAQKGQSIGSMYGFVNDGFYTTNDFEGLTYNDATQKWDYQSLKQGVADNTIYGAQPGNIKFKDLDGNGVVDLRDRQVIGNATPKFYGGLNQQFTFKNFDAGLFLNFVCGNDIYNANSINFSSGYVPGSNLLSSMDGYWRTVNAQGDVITDAAELASVNAGAKTWRPVTSSANYLYSSAVEDGSYLRVSNLTIGYSFPEKMLNKIKISKLRIYATGNNLGVITGYSGYDPDVNIRTKSPLSAGVDYSAHPHSRSLIFGVNLSL